MLVELDPASGTVRVDADGLEALATPGPRPRSPEVAAALESATVRRVLAARHEPLATMGLVVAGRDSLLTHRIWAGEEWAGLLLQVRTGLHQLMAVPPGHLAAALTRLARLRPRRVDVREDVPFPGARVDELVDSDPARRAPALTEAGADVAWRLQVRTGATGLATTVTDGPAGARVADPEGDVLRAVSNTTVYRILATALPAAVGSPA